MPSTFERTADEPATSEQQTSERHLDERLDEALDESFPASDPVAVHEPRAPSGEATRPDGE